MLVALLLLVVPGAIVARTARLTWPTAVAVGPALTYGVVALAIIPMGALGIPWNAWTALLALVIVVTVVTVADRACAAFANAAAEARAPAPRTGAGGGRRRAARRPADRTRSNARDTALAIHSEHLGCGLARQHRCGSSSIPARRRPRTWATSATSRPTTRCTTRRRSTRWPRSSATHRRRAHHRVHAELARRGGVAVPRQRSGADVASAAPPDRPMAHRRARRRRSGALSASFTAIPYVEFDTASMPNLAAYGVAVPTMVLIVSTLRHRDRIPLAVLALLGVFSVHITGGVVTVLFVVGVVAVRRAVASRPRPAGRLRQPAAGRHPDGAAAAAAVPRRAAAGRDHRRARVRHPRGQEAGLFDAVVQHTRHLNDFPIQSTLIIAGRDRRIDPAGAADLVAAGGVAAAGGVDRAFVGAVRRPDRRAHRQVQRPVLQRPAPAVGRRHDAARPDGGHRVVHADVGRGAVGRSCAELLELDGHPRSWYAATAVVLLAVCDRHRVALLPAAPPPDRREVRLGDRRRQGPARPSPTWPRCPAPATP